MILERIPKPARNDFLSWRSHLEPLLLLKFGIKPALERVAAETGTPYHTVKRRFIRYRKHGPLGLLEFRLCGPAFWRTATRGDQAPAATTCPGLVDLWKALCEESHRSCKTAHKRLVAMWRQRDSRIAEIPEFRDFPGWPALPKGWTYDNLMEVAPSKYELSAARVGRAASALHRPTVFTSRVGSYPGSHYLFDDKWHDFFVNDLATRHTGRPLEVYSLDLFSAFKLNWGFRIRERDAEGKYKGIAEVMMRYVLAGTLFERGYSPRGTTLITEAGTAKVRDGLAATLHDNTGGKITLDEGAVRGAHALLHQYPGLAKGNPRHKAALESNNNLEHNRFDFLPGQTGRNREERPEELAGRLKYDVALLAAYDQLPADKQALFQFPLLERNQFADLACHIYANIADDRDHRLDDWAECGNVVQTFELGGVTLRLDQLTPAQAEALPELLAKGLIKAKPVRATRREAWQRGAGDLIKLPGWGVVAILGDDLAREAAVRDNMFEIRSAEDGGGLFRYESILRTPEGHTAILKDRETYQVFINPFAPSTLFVRDAAGRYLGECARITAPSRGDVVGIDEAIKAASKREGQLLAPMRARHAAKAKERRDMHRNNADVAGGVTRAETKAANKTTETHNRHRAQLDAELAQVVRAATSTESDADTGGGLYD